MTTSTGAFGLDGRVVIVTGAARGIGRAIATEAVALGARIVLSDLDELALRGASEALPGGQAVAVHADVATAEGSAAVVRAALDTWGRLDSLVCNAGISRSVDLLSMTEAEWDEVVRIDLKGVFLGIQAAARQMARQRSGSVVAISSIGALRGASGYVHYVAAKAGVIGLVKAAALELAPLRVRVNAVAPGTVDTEMSSPIVSGDEATRGQHLARIPLGRFGQPVDVARTVTFLLSDASDWITGQVISVNGGAYL